MPRKAAKLSANHLRAWRESRGLTQAQLAEKIDTTDNVISMLESGDRQLTPKWLSKLAPVLDTRAGFLLEFAPEDTLLSLLNAFTRLPNEQKPRALRLIEALKDEA